jgi:hypothetical protein
LPDWFSPATIVNQYERYLREMMIPWIARLSTLLDRRAGAGAEELLEKPLFRLEEGLFAYDLGA